MVIALPRHRRAPQHAREVHRSLLPFDDGREDTPVGSETTDTAVWVHGELEVRERARGGGEEEKVARGGAERGDREEELPLFSCQSQRGCTEG